MKKFILFVTALFLVNMLPIHAQFVNSNQQSVANNGNIADEQYSVFSIGYNTNTFVYDDDDDDEFKGVAIKLTKVKKMSTPSPLYVDYGVLLTLGFCNDSEEDSNYSNYDYEWSIKKLSLSIPVNISYKINVDNNVLLFPYAGVHLTGNLIGKATYTTTYNDEEEEKDYNYFDKDDVGKDYVWKRMQYGFQVGANLKINKCTIGLEYSNDLNEICKKTKTSNVLFSVGLDI